MLLSCVLYSSIFSPNIDPPRLDILGRTMFFNIVCLCLFSLKGIIIVNLGVQYE